ncbi:MAG: queuosine precursor transporter [Rickettsiaceae bacterium]|nr:queuosine precursor transporter [Rickettsiaceae bacterium]
MPLISTESFLRKKDSHDKIAQNSKKNFLNSKYYHALGLMFTLILIVSNIAAIKVFSVAGFSLPGGMIVFPLLYILNDTLTEVYGFTASRRIIWSALLCNILVSGVLYIVVVLPPADHWSNHESYKNIFSLSPWIVMASIVSYITGESINAVIISTLKIKMKGGFFALRAIFSTFIGALIETTIFCFIAFSSQMPLIIILEMIINMTLIKVFYELFAMPITTRFVSFLKTSEDMNVFEMPTLSNMLPNFKLR